MMSHNRKKKRWATQVQQSVEFLHQIGVVWGDGKADNVLVDTENNAWLIDFGGGWTRGWVDESLAGTYDGDKQAIDRIHAFLGLATP